MTDIAGEQERAEQGSALEVLSIFLKLGVSCFGGPIAHIGYFREEFVVRREWIGEQGQERYTMRAQGRCSGLE